MILHMWSHFFKYWERRLLAPSTLLRKFQHVWDMVHDRKGMKLHAEEAISVHYYYTYAAYYLGGTNSLLAENMMHDLFDRTARFFSMVPEPRWSLTTLAFAFSARISALIRRSEGDSESCRRVMNVAIEKLRMGDRECVTRAAMLSSVLAKWLRQWDFLEESQMEDLRKARIRDSIGT